MINLITAFGIVILILLFTLVVLVYNSRSTENALINGFWKADPEFCQEAGLDLFLVYFGEGSYLNNKRPGYIVVKNEEGLIINNPVNFHMSGGYSIKPGISSCREYTLNIDWLDEPGYEDFFPSEQLLTYYPDCGKVVLSLDDQVYAVLYKDYIISDTNRRMPEETLKSEEEESQAEEI
jgi:hypothetical protein